MGKTVKTAGIAGAGILGKLTAYFLLERGWKVALFDEGDEAPSGPGAEPRKGSSMSASFTAAGMLAPYCEMEYAEPIVVKLGIASFSLWPGIIEKTGGVYFQREGSLVVSHRQDKNELTRLERSVERFTSEPVMKKVKRAELREIEPDIDPKIEDGLFFPFEGQVDTAGIMKALTADLRKKGAHIRFNERAVGVEPNRILTMGGKQGFDIVADCRGMGAKGEVKDLRGVRGEVLRVNAPEVSLRRPVRLMHPRYPIYIVPRPGHDYIIGATSIESEDTSTISVRGALELMSALYSVNSAFSEARITETAVQLRPALINNSPRIIHQKGLVRGNGLYRHGFLASPKVAELMAGFIDGAGAEKGFEELFEPES